MFYKLVMAPFLSSFFRFGVAQSVPEIREKTFYDFKLKNIDGEVVDFSIFKGKKVLVVNVASKCGFTPQYEGLEELHKTYKEKLVVIGFPSGDFKNQEFEKSEEIATFCQKNYGVTFLIMEKVHVKEENASPIYTWLSNKKLNGTIDKAPSWNFCKYLVDENGKVIEFYNSLVKPLSTRITKHL